MEKYHSQGKSPQTRKVRGPNKNRMSSTGVPSQGIYPDTYQNFQY